MGYREAAEIAERALDDLQGFTLTDDAQDAYRGYLRGVGQSYGGDTAKSIQEALLTARNDGLNLKETKERLRNILNTDAWRIERITRTELNHSQSIGRLEGFKSMRNEVGGTWEKTISHTGVTGICPLCASQDGVWTSLDDALWEFGDSITTINDKGDQVVYVNDFQSNQAWDYHPNGKGSLVIRRVDSNDI